ncbi:MAG: reactive intermediate/imine deaminase [Pseudonocardia sp.]|nr:reactive intermediate/imine deaminase [Pseudonocardia sp.]
MFIDQKVVPDMSVFNAVLARNPVQAPKPIGPYSQTVAFSHYNNISAQLPIDPATGAVVPGGVKEQATQVLANLRAVVEGIGHVMDDVVRLSVFVTDIADADTVDMVIASAFAGYVPTRTTVAVAALPLGAAVQIDALLTNGEGTIPNAPQAGDLVKTVNNTYDAPQSPASSQVVAFSHYSNITTQLPIDPATGRLVAGGVAEQTAQALANVWAVLLGIDVPVDDIVRVTIFVTDLADMDEVDAVYTTFFPDSAIARAVGYMPARTVVQAAALPMGARVQVEAVVSHGDGTPPQAVEDRHGIVIWARNTDHAPRTPLSTQTVAFSHYNHISAQLPIDAATGRLVPGGVAAQARQCLTHLKTIVESINHSLDDVVKVNLFLTDIADIAAVDEVYTRFFPGGVPARRTVGVSALPGGASIQVDAVVGNAEGTPPAR